MTSTRQKKVSGCGACLAPVVLVFMAVMFAAMLLFAKKQAADREERVAELEELVTPELRAAPELSRESACLIAEQRLLTRGPLPAVEVDCERARLEHLSGGASRLGPLTFIKDTSQEQSTLTLCLARTDQGWEIVGPAFRLDECAFEVVPGGTLEQQRAAAGSWRPRGDDLDW